MTDLIRKSHDNVGAAYWLDRDQRKLAERITAAEAQERARQDLQAGRSNAEALSYAMFLTAVESDATISHGSFKKFSHDSRFIQEVLA